MKGIFTLEAKHYASDEKNAAIDRHGFAYFIDYKYR